MKLNFIFFLLIAFVFSFSYNFRNLEKVEIIPLNQIKEFSIKNESMFFIQENSNSDDNQNEENEEFLLNFKVLYGSVSFYHNSEIINSISKNDYFYETNLRDTKIEAKCLDSCLIQVVFFDNNSTTLLENKIITKLINPNQTDSYQIDIKKKNIEKFYIIIQSFTNILDIEIEFKEGINPIPFSFGNLLIFEISRQIFISDFNNLISSYSLLINSKETNVYSISYFTKIENNINLPNFNFPLLLFLNEEFNVNFQLENNNNNEINKYYFNNLNCEIEFNNENITKINNNLFEFEISNEKNNFNVTKFNFDNINSYKNQKCLILLFSNYNLNNEITLIDNFPIEINLNNKNKKIIFNYI